MRLYEPFRRLPTNTAIFRVVLIELAFICFREARDAGDAAEVDTAEVDAAEVDAAEMEKTAVTLTEGPFTILQASSLVLGTAANA